MEGIRPTADSKPALSPAAPRVQTAAPARNAWPAVPTPIPPSPPPEVHEALDVAAQVLRQLEAQEIDLHFEMASDHTVRIQLLDHDGRVIREIPASKVADALAGSGSLAIDERG